MAKITDTEMQKLYEVDGLSILKIAEIAECGKSTVARKLNKLGVSLNNQRYWNLNISKDEIKKLYVEDQLTLEEIANIAGCTYSTIGFHLEKMGVDRRTRQPDFDDDIQEKIIKEYENGKSSRLVAEMFNCSQTTVMNYLHKNNVDVRTEGLTYLVDYNFFKCTDNEKTAYVLGLIYADGNINKNLDVITIALKKSDEELLLQIRDLIYPNKDRPLYNKETRHNNGEDMVGLVITSKKVGKDLHNLGVNPNKSLTLQFPNFDLGKFEHHFVRGYFDGDGWVTTRHRFGFIGTTSMMVNIQNILLEKAGIPKCKIQAPERYNGDTKKIEYGSWDSFRKIYNYLYKDATIWLKRKRDYFEEQLEV